MNKAQLDKALKALDTFDRAAQSHGWEQDQGSDSDAFRAKKRYKAAKSRLVNMLKEIAAADEHARGVPGLHDLLTVEERNALLKDENEG